MLCRFLFELGAQHLEHVVDGLFLEVGFLNEHVAGSSEHCLGGVESDALDGVDNPLVYLVRELVEVDVLVSLLFAYLTEYVDGILGEH